MPRLAASQGAKSVPAAETDQATDEAENLAEAAVEESSETLRSPRRDAATDPYEESGQQISRP